MKQFDVVVNAFGAPLAEEQAHVDAGRALIEAVRGTDTRGIMLLAEPGAFLLMKVKRFKLIDTPEFPDFVKPTARRPGAEFYKICRQQLILNGHLSALPPYLIPKVKEPGHISQGKIICL